MRHFIASARFAAASAFVKLFDLPLLGDLPRTSLVDSPEDVLCRVRRARTLPCACRASPPGRRGAADGAADGVPPGVPPGLASGSLEAE